ncbi:hypothetical protein DQ04_20461000 [Trypanosoma grayi]|uniref:hypothetical protein n=1 Tax=Trypanosoma grayi TaxID=71804 RepID=UPI0004F4682B|nr:hypothetical protein DQ04_20461000 [Trypanosoma grayi]KEG05564.1 hypothetical protein DQ04_20461000 [Trypanosoma grayi]
MMAAVGRPALFVVAVVLCCVCGCAAATAEAIGDEEQVIVSLQNAKKKAVQARNAVGTIKKATDNFNTEAEKASEKATELQGKVKNRKDDQLEDIAEVTRLAKDVLSATNTSHESLVSLCKNVGEAVESTTNAETLFTKARGMAGSAMKEVNEAITNKAKLAEGEFKNLLNVLKGFSAGQKCSEVAKKGYKGGGQRF